MLYDYSSADARSVTAAVESAISRGEALVAEIMSVDGPRTFDNTLGPLEEINRLTAVAYGRGPFLGQVSPDEATREAARAGEEKLEQWRLDLVSRRDLFRAIRDYSATEDARSRSGEGARALRHTVRDFRLAGHELNERDRIRVQELTSELITCGVRFASNLAEYEDHLEVTVEDLDGLPESYVSGLQPAAEANTYKITMAYPDVIPFMEDSPRRDLRERLAFKFSNRARADNTPLLRQALAIRSQLATMFGSPSWAHHSMVTKMAERPEAVADFYESIHAQLTAAGRRELADMERILADEGHSLPAQPWDRAYCHTVQMRRDGIDPTEVAGYFPLEQVIEGMLQITSEVLGLSYRKVDAPVWHDEVSAYRVTDSSTNELIAHFYMDLHPREGKFGHAAAFPLVPSGTDLEGAKSRPVSAIVANLPRPTGEVPSLLRQEEVVTLFHEFGHILHMSLSRAELARFSGSRTEWDFVEAPSQIMENWCWIPEVLERFARHHESGAPIPSDLVHRLTEARNLNVALFTLRQMMLGQIDMDLHGSADPVDPEAVLRARSATGLFPHHEGTFMLSSFGHLLGGYDAGYYGYLWAEVFGQDMFSRFAEEGFLSREVGMEYRRKVLEPGGTRDASDLLADFLGRPPRSDAFLRKLGILPDRQ